MQNHKGIIFDQHYTDSALKLLAPKSYKKNSPLLKTARSVPKQEILVSLLLFGKAYLSHPNWLNVSEFSELDLLINEDLVEWIPKRPFEQSYNQIVWYTDKLIQFAESKKETPYIFSLTSGGTISKRDAKRYEEYLLEKEIFESELQHDIWFMTRNLFYLSPLVTGNLNHLLISESPFNVLSSPLMGNSWLYPDTRNLRYDDKKLNFADFINFYNCGFTNIDLKDGYASFDYLFFDDYGQIYEDKEDEYFFSLKERRLICNIFDAIFSSSALEHFASETLLPIKTSGNKTIYNKPATIINDEAYQLIKIQFNDLRYPVIHTIDDVLRLRSDPHLNSYRQVIGEYSERLREDLENGRKNIINKFRNDMELALKSLKVVQKWSKVVDLSFYFSLPLVVIGTILNLPLSDIAVIPLTTVAKIVAHKKKKELDWILFGRIE